jgi:PKD repeat protein
LHPLFIVNISDKFIAQESIGVVLRGIVTMKIMKISFFLISIVIFSYFSGHGADYPVADFVAEPTSGYAPLTVQFTDLSTGQIESRQWDFDNNYVIDSTEQNPEYTYYGSGIYSVSVTVSGPLGNDTFVRENYIEVTKEPGSPGSVKWSYSADIESSSPAIDNDGNIYFGGGTYLYSLTPEGALRWRYNTGGFTDSRSPTIVGDKVYINSADGHLYALDTAGTFKWKLLPDEGAFQSEFLAAGPDGTIYLQSRHEDLSGRVSYGLYAVNPDRSVKWTTSSPASFRDPVVDKRNAVYVVQCRSGYTTSFVAFDKNGSEMWRTFLDSNSCDSYNLTPPAMDEKKIYLAEDKLYAINYRGGIEWLAKWWVNPGGDPYWAPIHKVRSVVIGDEKIYCTTGDGILYAISPDTGRTQWYFDDGIYIHSFGGAPCVGDQGTIYFSAYSPYDNGIIAISPDGNGSLKWYANNIDVLNSHSSPVINESTLYIGSNSGDLYAINTSDNSIASTAWPCVHKDIAHSGRWDGIQYPVLAIPSWLILMLHN